MQRLELVGQRFGRLTVLEHAGSRGGKSLWVCQCDCGNVCELDSRAIKRRRHCFECTRKMFTPPKQPVPPSPVGTMPGLRKKVSDGSTRACWKSLIMRAAIRGIEVDVRWKDFGNFLADMGQRPGPHYGIARLGLKGIFGPGNCKWMTVEERTRIRRQMKAAGERHHAREFMVGDHFSWSKWRAAGSPDYEIDADQS